MVGLKQGFGAREMGFNGHFAQQELCETHVADGSNATEPLGAGADRCPLLLQ